MLNPAGRQAEIRKRRVSLRGSVRVTPKTGGRTELLEYTDLSMGGMFIKTLFPCEVGTRVEVELRLLRLPFQAPAKVAWVRGYEQGPDLPCGMGLEFLDLSPLQRKALYRQIDEALEYGGEPMPGRPPTATQLAARRIARERSQGRSSWWSRLTRP